MMFGKKGGPYVAFPLDSWLRSETAAERAKAEVRTVREKRYTLSEEFIETYVSGADPSVWRSMLDADFEYVIEMWVADRIDFTRPDDGSRDVIVRGVPREDAR